MDHGRVTHQAFELEPDFPVGRDRVLVVFPNRQFDPLQPKGRRVVEGPPHQAVFQSLSPEFRQQGHPEHTGMGINRPRLGDDIAPANDLTIQHRDPVRITLRTYARVDSSGGASRNAR